MKTIKCKLSILVALLTTTIAIAQSKYEFSYALPESKGYSSEKLEVLKVHLEQSGSSAMLIMIDGKVIFEWKKPKRSI
ncbi:MAG: hypothetical protein AAF705_22095 [Bacteroidota bacterium]